MSDESRAAAPPDAPPRAAAGEPMFDEACELLRGWLMETVELDDPDDSLVEIEDATVAFIKRLAASPGGTGAP